MNEPEDRNNTSVDETDLSLAVYSSHRTIELSHQYLVEGDVPVIHTRCCSSSALEESN